MLIYSSTLVSLDVYCSGSLPYVLSQLLLDRNDNYVYASGMMKSCSERPTWRELGDHHEEQLAKELLRLVSVQSVH